MAGGDVRPLAAVTGATGFLGRRLVRALGAAGWNVRILVRGAVDAAEWGEPAPEVVRGDLADVEALRSLATGARVLVNCAGLVKGRSLATLMAVNAEGARRAAQAALDAGARLLMISSLTAREPDLSPYARSKHAGELAVQDVFSGQATVLRPPACYGPGDRETLLFFQLSARGSPMPMPDAPDARVALAHVDDVCAAMVAALTGPPGVFAIGGAQPGGYSFREIFETVARSVGRPPRLIAVPKWVFTAAGAASQCAGVFQSEPPIFTLGKAREFLHADWSVSAAELLPGAPPARFQLEEGLADTVAWYRAKGWMA